MKKQKMTNRPWLQRAAIKVAVLCASILLFAGQLSQAKQESELPGLGIQPDEVFFTGKTYSEELGGVVFKYRNYDPELNRWTAFDPSGFPDGMNNTVYGSSPLAGVDKDGLSWSWFHYVAHYIYGNGATVTLGDIGHLDGVKGVVSDVVDYAATVEGAAEAISKPYNGQLSVQPYSGWPDFGDVSFPIGHAHIFASFDGEMTSTPYEDEPGGTWSYSGIATFEFNDLFQDPLDIIQHIYGSSASPDAHPLVRALADLGGQPFFIVGSWTENYSGSGTYE